MEVEMVQYIEEMGSFAPLVVAVGVDLQLLEASNPSPQSPLLPLVKRIAMSSTFKETISQSQRT